MKKKVIIATLVVIPILIASFYFLIPYGPCPKCAIKVQYSSTKASILNLNTGIDIYKLYHDDYPDPVYALSNLIVSCGEDNWSGPYIAHTNDCFTDYWGTKFKYENVNGIPCVISAGPDCKFDTYDDYETNIRVNEDDLRK